MPLNDMPLEELRAMAAADGMQNLWEKGRALVLKGETDVAEWMGLYVDG